MFNSRHESIIEDLKRQRQTALNAFHEAKLVKNESLAEYFFCEFKKGEDIPFQILSDIPVGEALVLPVLYGGAIITTKEKESKPNEITYNTKWTSGSTLTMHYHSDCNETIEVIEGTIKLFVDGGTHVLKKGDKIEVAYNILHQVSALKESDLKITFRKIF